MANVARYDKPTAGAVVGTAAKAFSSVLNVLKINETRHPVFAGSGVFFVTLYVIRRTEKVMTRSIQNTQAILGNKTLCTPFYLLFCKSLYSSM